jgi:phosphate transport system substrate-binding protein
VRALAVASLLLLALALSGCGRERPSAEPLAADTTAEGEDPLGAFEEEALSGRLSLDGSSTVAPLMSLAAERFRKADPKVKITVGTSGTGGGFTKFCNGETDISDASRAIEDDEKQACAAKGIKYQEFRVGLDGLAVVSSAQNQFVDTLSFEQLAKIFEEGGATTWNQVDPKFPNEKIAIFAPDTESGTYDFFNEEVLGDPEEGGKKPRSDYTASSDDNTLVQGIEGEANSWGYFGFAYYQNNREGLKIIKVAEKGATGIEPTAETIESGDWSDETQKALDASFERPQASLVSFFAYALIPDTVRPQYFDNMISGIATVSTTFQTG